VQSGMHKQTTALTRFHILLENGEYLYIKFHAFQASRTDSGHCAEAANEARPERASGCQAG